MKGINQLLLVMGGVEPTVQYILTSSNYGVEMK